MESIFAETSITRQGYKYADLSAHDFTDSEKTWLCLSIVEGLDPSNHLSKQIKKPNISSMAERYKIPRSTIRNWVVIYKNKGQFLKHGGQSAVDEVGLRKIGEVLEDFHNETYTDMYDDQLAAVFDEQAFIFFYYCY
jgi:hypothetical protein